MRKEKARQVNNTSHCGPNRAGIFHVRNARRRGFILGGVPHLRNKLAMIIRVCAEELRTAGINPMIGHRANGVWSRGFGKAKYRQRNRQSGGNGQRERSQPNAQAGHKSTDMDTAGRGDTEQPDQEEGGRQGVGRNHLPAGTLGEHLYACDQHRDERDKSQQAFGAKPRNRQGEKRQHVRKGQYALESSHHRDPFVNAFGPQTAMTRTPIRARTGPEKRGS